VFRGNRRSCVNDCKLFRHSDPTFLLNAFDRCSDKGIRHELMFHNQLCLNMILASLTCQPLCLWGCKEFRRSSAVGKHGCMQVTVVHTVAHVIRIAVSCKLCRRIDTEKLIYSFSSSARTLFASDARGSDRPVDNARRRASRLWSLSSVFK
jgi:hypothetical protein